MLVGFSGDLLSIIVMREVKKKKKAVIQVARGSLDYEPQTTCERFFILIFLRAFSSAKLKNVYNKNVFFLGNSLEI